MSKIKFLGLIAFVIAISTNVALSQKIAFISSDQIRELFPEAKQADNRLQTIVEEWKREIKELDQKISAKEFEIKKNRLIWSDPEMEQANGELQNFKDRKMDFAKQKFEASGEYDRMVKIITKPVEDKIFAAVQKVAAEEGYDMIWDKSTQPLPYVNFKYDLTLKVLKELNVDVEELEKELKEKIDKDPRNKKSATATSNTTKTKRTRERKTKDIEKENTNKENQDIQKSSESQEKKQAEEKTIEKPGK